MKNETRDLSLYIHIPFCRAKCNYCDFLSFGGCSISEQREYVNALCKEIGAYSLIADEYRVAAIFFGGGTPSFIDAELIGKILEKIRETFTLSKDCEITIEGNPDSLTRDKLAAYRSFGINRLSIGLQSTNDEMLRLLGRVHNYDQFIAAYSRARKAGFDNINIDIMSGLPGESMESYVKTLGKVVELQPEHISAYSLIVEDGTPLAEDKESLSKLPSEELDRKQYARTKLLLRQSGYERYEISNYARTGYECRHNLTYWQGGEYLGLGLGAASYIKIWDDGMESMPESMDNVYLSGEMWENGVNIGYDDPQNDDPLYNEHRYIAKGINEKLTAVRFKGVDSVDEYIGRFSRFGSGWTDINSIKELINNYYTEIQVLKEKDMIEEFMFLGLRCIKGVSRNHFYESFGKSIDDIYGSVIDKYVASGHLISDGDSIYLSDMGLDVSNTVMAEFLL